jgi:type II secretory pathway pseudopilin PulG
MCAGERRAVRGRQRGFTYVTVMAAVALLGIGLAALGPLWADDARRERERELLRVGKLYARAIADYHASSPGNTKSHPPDLQSLLMDKRFVGVRRPLRKPYPDPLMPSRPWGLVRAADGGIAGVFSQDERAPLRRESLDAGIVVLPAARRYSDWKFVPDTTP